MVVIKVLKTSCSQQRVLVMGDAIIGDNGYFWWQKKSLESKLVGEVQIWKRERERERERERQREGGK